MYKLFSRAIEARSSCHCAICSSVRPGVARKVNTLPIRQRIRLGDVATIVYGTVLGTAAFYDGSSKKRRRRAMDDAIAGVVSENKALLENQEARLRSLGYDGSEYGPPSDDAIASNSWSEQPLNSLIRIATRPIVSWPGSPSVRRFSSSHGPNCASMESLAYKTEEQVTEAPALEEEGEPSRHGRLPIREFNSVFPEERALGKTIEEAWNEDTLIPYHKNLHIREAATLLLVLRLIKMYLVTCPSKEKKNASVQFTSSRGVEVKLAPEDMLYIDEKIEDLTSFIDKLKATIWTTEVEPPTDSLPLPNYRLYDRCDGQSSTYHDDVKAQNQRLSDILLQAKGPRDLVSNICTFLMSQSAAPCIHTINLLLIKFLDVRWFAAVEVVCKASTTFGMNHNEVTDSAILEYFHLTKDFGRLESHQMRMLGADGRVTRAAYEPNRFILADYSPEQLVEQVRERNGILTVTHGLKAGWTPEAFTIVILNLLRRGSLMAAFTEVATMRISGLKETPEILDAFLQYSVINQDWRVAVKTWIRYEALGHTKFPLTWYWMLQACSVCKQPEVFRDVVTAGQKQGSLSKTINYEMRNFILSAAELGDIQSRVMLLRGYQHRIFVTGMPHRNIKLHPQDILQLPNLNQTLLMVSIQYAKLRLATCRWSFSTDSDLDILRRGLEGFMAQHSGDHSILKKFLDDWAGYDMKLAAIAALCDASYIEDCSDGLTDTIKRIAGTKASEIKNDPYIAQLRAAFAEQPPASTEFYKFVSQQNTTLLPLKKALDHDAAETIHHTEHASTKSRLSTTMPKFSDKQGITKINYGFPHRETWYHSIRSEVSRKIYRASSQYACTRYWNRVLYPRSPANLHVCAAEDSDHLSTGRIPVAANQINTAVHVGTSMPPQLQRLDEGSAALGTAHALSGNTSENAAEVARRRAGQKRVIVQSSRLRMDDNSPGGEGASFEIQTTSGVREIPENGQSHVPWQSLKTGQSRQEDNERRRTGNESDSLESDDRLGLGQALVV